VAEALGKTRLAGEALPLVRQARLDASFGVKCPCGNYVSVWVRTNHPPIPSVAVVEEVRVSG